MIQISKGEYGKSIVKISDEDFVYIQKDIKEMLYHSLLEIVSFKMYSFSPNILYPELKKYTQFFSRLPEEYQKESQKEQKRLAKFGETLSLISLLKKSPDKEAFIQKNVSLRRAFKEYNEIIRKNISDIVFNKKYLEITTKQIVNSFPQSLLPNIANFSEPGSGKTIMTLFDFVHKTKGQFDDWRMIVVSPISAFTVWKQEILKFIPSIKEEEIHIFHKDYKAHNFSKDITDILGSKIILINFQNSKKLYENSTTKDTLQNKKNYIIYDEVHRIKNGKGKYRGQAGMLVDMAKNTAILTGTPFSRDFNDIKSIIELSWKENLPLNLEEEIFSAVNVQWNELKKKSNDENFEEKLTKAVETFMDSLYPYFLRLTKSKDFQIKEPNDNFEKPILSQPTKAQVHNDQFLFDQMKMFSDMAKRKETKEKEEFEKMVHIMQVLLRQNSTSSIYLKRIEVNEEISTSPSRVYDETKIADDVMIKQKELEKYSKEWRNNLKFDDELEIPSKIKDAISKIEEITSRDKKIIVWAEFVATNDRIHYELKKRNINSYQIYGKTPKEDRETFINNFKDKDKNEVKVIIANPLTIGESISLHKTVFNSLFVERSLAYFSWAQAKDRIHRVGSPEEQIITHDYIRMENLKADDFTFDNLKRKLSAQNAIFKQKVSYEELKVSASKENYFEGKEFK